MGKQITLYLKDSTVDGIVDIDVMNWAGKALKIPRNEIDNADWPDGMSSGVYFLMCVDEQNGNESVYIGESLDVKKRLNQHIGDYKRGKERFYWHTAVVFIGSQLNKNHTQYMENALRLQAQASGKYEILTQATSAIKMNIGTQDSCNQFIKEIKILLGLLKYKIYDEAQTVNKNALLFCQNTKGAYASGYVSANGFTVLKGSKVSADITPSFTNHNYYKLRQKLEQTHIIENGVFVKDCDDFSAPSAASSIILGRPSNGKTDWKNKSGTVLKDLV